MMQQCVEIHDGSEDKEDKSFLWDPEAPNQCPVTYIPLKPSNPTKLTVCYLRNDKWYATCHVRYF